MSAEADRHAALSEAVAEAGLDRLLVNDELDLRWLTGFTGTSGAALCPAAPGETGDFVTDFRYVEQAGEQLGAGWEIARARKELLGEGLAEATGDRELGRLGFDPRSLTVAQLAALSGALAGRADLVEAPGLVDGLRVVKDDREISRIHAAAALADQALGSVLERGIVSRTEREIAVDLEVTMIGLGAERLSFPPIVASGAHGALPHAEPRDVAIPGNCLVTIDWGAQLDGYCSDCTRTYATGPVGDRERDAYEAVNRAREAAIEAIRPGPSGREIDAVARTIMDEAGLGEEFGHGLGHGVGLDVHEEPRLSPRGTDEPLVAGMVVTVEPGAYVAGSFGIRIEDLVVITQDGHRVLTGIDRELQTVD